MSWSKVPAHRRPRFLPTATCTTKAEDHLLQDIESVSVERTDRIPTFWFRCGCAWEPQGRILPIGEVLSPLQAEHARTPEAPPTPEVQHG